MGQDAALFNAVGHKKKTILDEVSKRCEDTSMGTGNSDRERRFLISAHFFAGVLEMLDQAVFALLIILIHDFAINVDMMGPSNAKS